MVKPHAIDEPFAHNVDAADARAHTRHYGKIVVGLWVQDGFDAHPLRGPRTKFRYKRLQRQKHDRYACTRRQVLLVRWIHLTYRLFVLFKAHGLQDQNGGGRL